MDSRVCQPAMIYLIIALVLLFVAILINLNSFNIGTAFSQLSSILICTLILMGICAVAPGLSWLFVIIFIICTLSGLLGAVVNWFRPPTY